MDTTTPEFFLAYASALEAWRLIGPRPVALDAAARLRDAVPPHAAWLRSDGHASLTKLARPLNLLVGTQGGRRCTRDIKCHSCQKELPPNAFCSWGQGIYLSSPSFCFLQMASSLDQLDLAMLGYELCGTYSVTDHRSPGLWNHRALTHVGEIETFLAGMGTPWSLQKAREALRLVLDDSNSPMESATALLFVAPRRMGGYALPRPVMNQRVELDERARAAAGRAYLVVDLCWPEHKLALEYDSNLFHAAAAQRTSDSQKRLTLQAMDYKVLTLTARQLYDAQLFRDIALDIAGTLGVRLRDPSYDWPARHAALHDRLLPSAWRVGARP